MLIVMRVGGMPFSAHMLGASVVVRKRFGVAFAVLARGDIFHLADERSGYATTMEFIVGRIEEPREDVGLLGPCGFATTARQGSLRS